MPFIVARSHLLALTLFAGVGTRALVAQSDSVRKADSAAFEFANPNATRLYFAPTGRMLPKGEGYFSDFYIFFPGVNVGITDRVSIGGMMSVFPGIGLQDQVYFLTPKVGLVQKKAVNVAVGALIAGWDGGAERETAGIMYGVGTWGSEDGSLTAGLGYGFVNGKVGSSPFVMIGGERRASNRVSFVTENWMLPGGEYGLASGGIRFLGKGMAVDFGLMTVLGARSFDGVAPILGFLFKW